MTKKILLTNLLLFWLATFVSAQQKRDFLLWSDSQTLSVEDFQIKTKQNETTPSFAQFTVNYQVFGLNFLIKNFNKNVHNYFIKSASWIDTTTNVQQSLIYQQTLFDLCEVYTRQFRKALSENRKKIMKGKEITEELNNKFISAFAKRRLDYDRETKFGTDAIKQKDWDVRIQKELKQLSDYAHDK